MTRRMKTCAKLSDLGLCRFKTRCALPLTFLGTLQRAAVGTDCGSFGCLCWRSVARHTAWPRTGRKLLGMQHLTAFRYAWVRQLAIVSVLVVDTVSAWAQVGYSERQFGDLSVTMVYPTAAPGKPSAFGPFTLDVAVGAAPSPGRHRLVVLSHGTGGSALADHALARAMVLQGLVVAQPLHRSDNWRDTRDAGPTAFERRPSEVLEVIDVLAADAQWAAHLALDRVGVHGMSAGAVSALSLAGAQWRTLELIRHCQDNAQQDPGFCLQGAVTAEQKAARLERYASARGVPEGLFPKALTQWHGGIAPETAAPTPTASAPAPSSTVFDPRPDLRIAAVTLAVPVAAVFSAASLARITIPLGVVSAQRDQWLPPRFHAEHVLAHCPTCIRLMDIPGAGHMDLLWPWPATLAAVVAAVQAHGGAPEPGFDPALRDEAQRRIASFMREKLR